MALSIDEKNDRVDYNVYNTNIKVASKPIYPYSILKAFVCSLL